MKKKLAFIMMTLALIIAMALPIMAAEAQKAKAKNPTIIIVICVVIGIIVGLIVITSIKGKYKAIRSKSSASDYLVKGSFNLTSSNEKFIRKDTQQNRIQKDSSN